MVCWTDNLNLSSGRSGFAAMKSFFYLFSIHLVSQILSTEPLQGRTEVFVILFQDEKWESSTYRWRCHKVLILLVQLGTFRGFKPLILNIIIQPVKPVAILDQPFHNMSSKSRRSFCIISRYTLKSINQNSKRQKDCL